MINIVLYQPEIPQNTANIIRTCASIGAKLHIIKPISFSLHPHWLKRAAAGRYLSNIKHEIHKNYQEFQKINQGKCIFFLTRYSKKIYSSVNYCNSFKKFDEIFFVFGRESTGIDIEILKKNINNCLRIPMLPQSRSINLANSVAIVAFEAMRQINFKNLSFVEVQKGENFLWKN